MQKKIVYAKIWNCNDKILLLVSSENKMAIFFFVKKWIIQKIGTYIFGKSDNFSNEIFKVDNFVWPKRFPKKNSSVNDDINI